MLEIHHTVASCAVELYVQVVVVLKELCFEFVGDVILCQAVCGILFPLLMVNADIAEGRIDLGAALIAHHFLQPFCLDGDGLSLQVLQGVLLEGGNVVRLVWPDVGA